MIYQDINAEPTKVTENDFKDKVSFNLRKIKNPLVECKHIAHTIFSKNSFKS